MNSSLTEKERVALDEVFLSISTPQSIFDKMFFLHKNKKCNSSTHYKTNTFSMTTSISKAWKSNKITKLFAKLQKRRNF